MSAPMSSPRTISDTYYVDGHSLEAIKIEARHSNVPTIVMLHEGLGSIAHWKDFPSQLAEETGAGVFVYSRHGHGASDRLQEPRAESYMHQEAQIVLPEILRQAGIECPCFLATATAHPFPSSTQAPSPILRPDLFWKRPTCLSKTYRFRVLRKQKSSTRRRTWPNAWSGTTRMLNRCFGAGTTFGSIQNSGIGTSNLFWIPSVVRFWYCKELRTNMAQSSRSK